MLNELPIHKKDEKDQKFRNPNGVYMKLTNFLRLDPNYKGKGLERGSKLEEDVWNDYYNELELLKKTVKAIKNNYQLITEEETIIEEDKEEYKEGKILTKIHKIRERNKKIVKQKKEHVLKATGKLNCEVCGFNYEKFYGDIGSDFIECHHIKPIYELDSETKTTINDLALVCANCHRMIHAKKQTISLDKLKELIKK